MAADRPDIQYAVKEVCRRRMAKPVQSDWSKLVRLAMYLKERQGWFRSTVGKPEKRE